MEIRLLTDKFMDAWYRTNETETSWGKPIGLEEKKSREAFVNTFFQSMKKLDADMLAHYSESDLLDGIVLTQLRDLFQKAFSYRHEEIDLMFSAEMMTSTKNFIKQARSYDRNLPIESVFQACRNVWIMNGLQLILGYPVELTPAIFAYSMLYPYTDNFVDDPQVSSSEKVAFSQRFSNRLSGLNVFPENEQEAKIFQMVDMIEGQFERSAYPGVYESLLGIHRAQTDSMELFQQKQLSDEDALRICIAKGGTSVLADGYLITGDLKDDEKNFLFGYGAYLQLLDDVQDVKEDLDSGLMTTFSSLAQTQKLDAIIFKTFNFGEQVLNDSKELLSRVELDFKGLLQKSILLFFVESVAMDSQFYSSQFQSELEKIAPFSFSFVRNKRNFFTPKKHLLLEKLNQLTEPTEKCSLVGQLSD